jgi:hypothetical protein
MKQMISLAICAALFYALVMVANGHLGSVLIPLGACALTLGLLYGFEAYRLRRMRQDMEFRQSLIARKGGA